MKTTQSKVRNWGFLGIWKESKERISYRTCAIWSTAIGLLVLCITFGTVFSRQIVSGIEVCVLHNIVGGLPEGEPLTELWSTANWLFGRSWSCRHDCLLQKWFHEGFESSRRIEEETLTRLSVKFA